MPRRATEVGTTRTRCSPVRYQAEHTLNTTEEWQQPLQGDAADRQYWSEELREAFRENEWRLRVEQDKTCEHGYRASIFVRFRDQAFGTIERVRGGWRLVIPEVSASMIFGTTAGLLGWLVRACK